jgi:hypothetical protein
MHEGVPQGSVLALHLFLFVIDDLQDRLPGGVHSMDHVDRLDGSSRVFPGGLQLGSPIIVHCSTNKQTNKQTNNNDKSQNNQ